ncbi:MAG: flavodoxin family protein [Deltaproteobacteria bacterium]|jgi:flavodoxin|nr:flavodoxin family protein [Deltaproteobacteria bacterium]
MKTQIIYCSQTSNTRQVAQALFGAIGPDTTLVELKDNPEPLNGDLLFLGFWIDRARVNQEMADFMARLKNQTLAFFFTQVGWPEGPTARRIVQRTTELLTANSNVVLGAFHCQGRMNPAIIAMARRLPVTHPRGGYSFARAALLAESNLHPDQTDLAQAAEFGHEIMLKYLRRKQN